MTVVKTHYTFYPSQQRADAPYVLMLPGMGGGVWMYGAFAKQFTSDYNVICFNNPGVGGYPIMADMRVRKLAESYANAMDEMGIKKAHVVAHSMGGFVAQRMAFDFAEKVDQLVLISTSYGRPQTQMDMANMAKVVGADLVGGKKVDSLESLQLEYQVHKDFKEEKKRGFLAYQKLKEAHMPNEMALASHMSCAALFSSAPYVRDIAHNVLVIHGTDDLIVSYESGQKLAAQLQNAHFLTYEKCGHLHFIEYDNTHQPILDFLKGATVGEAVTQSTQAVTHSVDYMIDSIMRGAS